MLGGYMGKVLRVNLTEESTSIQTLSEEMLRQYIGGSGLGAKILFDETSEETDPLGPDNLLIFMTGPLVGTSAPNFGRYQVITKSPLTGAYGEGNAGGSWGTNLKRAGYDGIVIVGKAKRPVYIYINNGEVEIRDATHLWGKDTYETDDILKREIDSKLTICGIGQAGEKLVKIAAIMNDGVDGRAAARCGMGAVMGSKNLKAIAVKGVARPLIVKEEEFKASTKEWALKIRSSTEDMLGKYGTSCGIVSVEAVGDLPIKNWTKGQFPNVAKISGQAMAASILTKRYYCAQCVIGCGRTIRVEKGPFNSIEGGGPEYETLGMLGSNLMIDNLEAIAKGNELCNRYGLDTISTGACIAFAMEAYERGIITKSDLGGIELFWGDPEGMLAMIEKIAFRDNIGDILAEGVKIASEKLGQGASEFAVHVRGLEFPAHDPRAGNATALAYATSSRGACHLNAFTADFELAGAPTPEPFNLPEKYNPHSVEGKAELVAKFQDLMALLDSLTGCKFILFGLGSQTADVILEWTNMATGWDMSMDEFLMAGARIVTLKRMYNIRQGQSRKDDVLPFRMMTHRRGTGGAADNLPHIGYMLSEYYAYRKWDEFGIPTNESLEELNLK